MAMEQALASGMVRYCDMSSPYKPQRAQSDRKQARAERIHPSRTWTSFYLLLASLSNPDTH